MFAIRLGPAGEVVMAGRLDATQCAAALEFLNGLAQPRVVDLGGLDYIASAGLRVLLLTQKRIQGSGVALKLVNVRPPIGEIFRYAGFDQIMDITRTTP
jgi:stage II sporulation protein AA (anti-sigma F factor antagonist)